MRRSVSVTRTSSPGGGTSFVGHGLGGGARAPDSGERSQAKIMLVTRDNVRTLRPRDTGTRGVAPEAVVIGSADYLRIVHEAKQRQQESDEAAAQQRAAEPSEERKQRMRNIDAARAKAQRPPTVGRALAPEQREALARAHAQLDEQLDEVKEMNKLVRQAKAVAIRDMQLAEKTVIAEAKAAEERRLDEAIAAEREAAIAMYAEREIARHEEQRAAAAVIREQIQERSEARFKTLARIETERVALAEQLKQLRSEEQAAAAAKQEVQRSMRHEIDAANAELAKRKEVEAQREADEQARILAYHAEKDAREAAYQAEVARVKAARDREIAHVRALQSRAQDTQSARDELLARRAAEAHERDVRAREKAAAEKKKANELELKRSREAQHRHKERQLADQARRERAEFESVLAVQRAIKDADAQRAAEEAARAVAYRNEVRAQMMEREEAKLRERQATLEEGRHYDLQQAERREHLEAVRARKLAELRAAGVPEVYCRDLENMSLERPAKPWAV